jgi:predicted acylesterase/phospholipase RssA/CRP-like cAMP-binding protein
MTEAQAGPTDGPVSGRADDRDSDEAAAARLVAASVPELIEALGMRGDGPLAGPLREVVAPVRIRAGETLFQAGDHPDAAYFVVTGRLVVFEVTSEGEVPIRSLGHGDIIGEIGLIEGTARSATIRADRDAIIARLSRQDFERFAYEHPEFLMSVARIVVRRLAHPRPQVDAVGTIAVAVTHPELGTRLIAARLLQEMERIGPAAHLSAAAVDARLGAEGVAQSLPGSAGALRVSRLLDGFEAEHRFVLLEADSRLTHWSRAAMRHADRVIIVMSQDPDAAESELIAALAESAGPSGRHGKWLVPVRPADADRSSGIADLVERFGAERAINVREGSSDDIARLARLVTGTGVGLVLGGGGARGFAHLGVYRAMVELGIPVDAVAGASIGGILGAGIARGADPADALVATAKRRFASVLDYTLPMVSLVKGARITRETDGEFGGYDIEDLLLPFLCVSTNLTTSRPVVHQHGPVTRATRAGLAIPGVIPPVPSDGDLLVDGGVLDNLPIDHLRDTGLVGTVIAVDVAPPVGPRARSDYGLSVSGWRALRAKLRGRGRRFPGLGGLLVRSMLVGSMKERDRQIASGLADLYLDLDLRGVSLLAFGDVESVAAMGYESARPRIEAWWAERAAVGV